MDRITWRIKEYFVQNFFPSMKKTATAHKKRILEPQYMILIKFIADSAIFGEMTKMSFPRDDNRFETVNKKTWTHTSIFTEQIYFAWEVFLRRVGFRNAEEFLRLFLYYDRKTGKLKNLEGNKVFPREEKMFVQVEEGIRDKDIEISISTADNPEIKETVIGIDRKELDDDTPFKYVQQKTYETLRQCAENFLVDLYNEVLNPTILLTGRGSVKEKEVFLRFHMDNSESDLPVRFASMKKKIIELREDLGNARQKANSVAEETTASKYYPEATIENADTVIKKHNCDPDCNCTTTKANV